MPSLTMADAASRTVAKKWIKSATSNAHGQFRKKAEAAGESTKEFAKDKADAPGRLGRQARLAENLMSMKHGKSSHALYEKKKD